MKAVRRFPVAAGFAILFSTPVLASTYVVDDNGGPGVDFTDLPAAVAAAQPGDVLRVMPGAYSAFTCTEGITIVGYGHPTVNGTVEVFQVPDGNPFVLAGVTPARLHVFACDASVIVQQIPFMGKITIESSVDVRLLDVKTWGGAPPAPNGLNVIASRVEVVQSEVLGAGSDICTAARGSGMSVISSSRVHFALSDATGGQGPDCYFQGEDPANGGDGIFVSGSELILAGGGVGTVRGGGGGLAWWWDPWNCYYDSAGGIGVRSSAADVRYSRVEIQGGFWCDSPSPGAGSCDCWQSPATVGQWFTEVPRRHSTLALNGTATAGGAVELTLRGVPGSRAAIWIGRKLLLRSEPGVDIELAVERKRLIDLGDLPASGSITRTLDISGSDPTGTLYAVQGECRLTTGEVKRTNSVPIVVR